MTFQGEAAGRDARARLERRSGDESDALGAEERTGESSVSEPA